MLLLESMLSEKLLTLEQKLGGGVDDAISLAGVLKLICCFDPPIFGGGSEGAEDVELLAGGVPLYLMDSLVFAIVVLLECGRLSEFCVVRRRLCWSSVFCFVR